MEFDSGSLPLFHPFSCSHVACTLHCMFGISLCVSGWVWGVGMVWHGTQGDSLSFTHFHVHTWLAHYIACLGFHCVLAGGHGWWVWNGMHLQGTYALSH